MWIIDYGNMLKYELQCALICLPGDDWQCKVSRAVETGLLTTYKCFLPQDIYQIPSSWWPPHWLVTAHLWETLWSPALVAQIWMHAAKPIISQTQQLFILGSSPPPHPVHWPWPRQLWRWWKLALCTTAFLLGLQTLHWEYHLLKFTLRAYCKQV